MSQKKEKYVCAAVIATLALLWNETIDGGSASAGFSVSVTVGPRPPAPPPPAPSPAPPSPPSTLDRVVAVSSQDSSSASAVYIYSFGGSAASSVQFNSNIPPAAFFSVSPGTTVIVEGDSATFTRADNSTGSSNVGNEANNAD